MKPYKKIITELKNGTTSNQNSLLRLNAYFQDTQNVPEWNEDAIVKRAELLFNTAKVLWPYPVIV